MSEHENELIAQRQKNLTELVELGFEAYPHRFDRTHTVSEAVAEFGPQTAEELVAARPIVKLAGRIHAINRMGKAAFVRFTDGKSMIQAYLRRNEIGESLWELFLRLDLGDVIGVSGFVFRTKTGELSVHAEDLKFLVKALTPPPDKFHGLQNKELRYRQRYADLIANHDVRTVFEKRAQIIRETRAYFDQHGYIEVETPMLSPLATGAAARPFVTHHNALDIPLFARIAPELYLKRLTVGGFERVYELNRNFRNEGLSIKHNPEFTMLEFYQAYSSYEDLIELTEELITGLVEKVCGTLTIPYGDYELNFSRPWARFTMAEAIQQHLPEAVAGHALDTLDDLIEVAKAVHCELKATEGYGKCLGILFEHVAEPHLIQPTFITRFPTDLSPLSKQSPDNKEFVDRFELFIARMECANGFSELNDPAEQRRRFEDQVKARERGDDEAMVLDEDYIRALSYGLPPTAGEGIGIDRIVMILTNQRSIRDVILFPHMRPEAKHLHEDGE
ncbi:MAG TPA: lysine--tRNA ligase [Acidobacteriota bacterium]|nr:lysine--tRNA ligase [Acidobacteriota bacterium]HNB71330.1 lysine--tRNA ligase [Acidobacteriota bacterium]HND21524.1 lysine--tRNA ligase [Acidobacteriota bacterium]HNG95774.1 lysine--tRNA ligase [Acidobacteriota bacterium]HNH81599.1 lysine--tRNA ligase [Acidobacteriota bacterium]